MKNIFKNIAFVLSALAVSIIVGYAVLAWTEPANTPPNNNVAAPINTGTTAQTKSGDLATGGKMTAGQFCVGAVCISVWPTTKTCSAGEAITGYNATTGTFTCGTGGTCTPTTTCTTLGYQCGSAIDNCGNALDCGVCSGGITCTNHQCGCIASTQACSPNGANATCCSGTCTDGLCTNYHPCVKEASPGKRIFTTSMVYKSSSFSTAYTSIDNLPANKYCQTIAVAAGLSGTYRALIHFNYGYGTSSPVEYNPINALPSSTSFWVGAQNTAGNDCDWTKIANNATEMFNGGGIATPIRYDETGIATSALVWTNFQPTGGGGYVTLANTAGNGMCACVFGWGDGFDLPRSVSYQESAANWYGNSNNKNISWATYKVSNGGTSSCDECQTISRALYCVEQ